MLAADKAAEDEEIVRIGVGISVEELNQAPNFKPDKLWLILEIEIASLARNSWMTWPLSKFSYRWSWNS